VALHIITLSLASQIIPWTAGLFAVQYDKLPWPVCLFIKLASLADALAGCLLFFGLVRILPAPINHWHLSLCNFDTICKFI
jgi:hypothetical protein